VTFPKSVTVVLGKTVGSEVSVRWYDPRTGAFTPSEIRANSGIIAFVPPDQGPEQDWVLVLNRP
jgi:hypothetical protein